jgi:hypothetical protein
MLVSEAVAHRQWKQGLERAGALWSENPDDRLLAAGGAVAQGAIGSTVGMKRSAAWQSVGASGRWER